MGDWDYAKLPTLYNRAKKALEQCNSLDECREWKNRAAALASYARQMRDTDLEKNAYEVKRRARIRFGELSNDRSPQSGGDRRSTGAMPPLGRQAAARAVGVSDTERKVAQREAKMPKEEQEASIAAGKDKIDQRAERSPPPAKPRWFRPSALADAVKVIANVKSMRAVEPEES